MMKPPPRTAVRGRASARRPAVLVTTGSVLTLLLVCADGALPVEGRGERGGRPPREAIAEVACEGCARFVTDSAGAPPEAAAAFAEAERIWSGHLLSAAPIRIRMSFARLQTKAITISNPINSLDGVLPGDTWYPMALADALAGRDLAPNQCDMEIFFSDSVDWHYDVGADVPEGKVDFLSVAIHEIAHGLGFASLLRFSNGRIFYELAPGERFPPLSFDVPDLKGAPAIFDRFIETGAGQRIMEAAEETRRVTLGRAVLEGRLYFGGANAVRRSEGSRPRLLVSDPSHVDPAEYDLSAQDALMTPKALPGRATRAPGPIVLGVLEDLGWKVRDAQAVAGDPRDPASRPSDPAANP